MRLISGAILFGADASFVVEPPQDAPEFVTPWPTWFIAPAPPPPAEPPHTPPAFLPVADGVPQALPQPWPSADTLPGATPPFDVIPADPVVEPGAPLPPGAWHGPDSPPAEPLPVEAFLVALAGTPRPVPPSAPPGAPPPGSGTLDFGALLALLLVPAIEPPQPVGEIPAPFLPPAPVAEEPWGLRDWSLL